METSNLENLLNTLDDIISEEISNNESNIEDAVYEEVTDETTETFIDNDIEDLIGSLESELEAFLNNSVNDSPISEQPAEPVESITIPPENPLRGSISDVNIRFNDINAEESALQTILNAEAEVRATQDSISELMKELMVIDEDSKDEALEEDSVDLLLKGEDLNKVIAIRSENRYNNLAELIDSMESKTVLTSRFSGLGWAASAGIYPVTLIGQGGIGSFVNLFISRIRPKYIYLYDDDVYEYANLSGQLISGNLLGEAKVKGASQIGLMFSNYSDYILCKGRFTSNSILTPITITGLDNMTGRKEAYYTWKERFQNDPAALFVDGRLTVENFQIFSLKGGGVDLENMKDYEENHLFGEGEAIANICSMKQTSHIAGMIGSYITNIYTNFINNLSSGSFPLYVPYYVEYNANMFNLEVKGDYI